MDGHCSHYTPKLLRYAAEQNIKILGHPPHCTHVLQGLDIVCFVRMKQAWVEEVEAFEARNDCRLNKSNFANVFGLAFLKTFTSQCVLAAFRATGIVPFDPTVITPNQMKPSIPTAVKGSFPLPQPSPVWHLISAMRIHPPTTVDIDKATHTFSSPKALGSSAFVPSSLTLESNPNIDPALLTPSKRCHSLTHSTVADIPSKWVWLLTSSLAMSKSGSFLVLKAPIMSAQPIIRPMLEAPPRLDEPNWSLLETVRQQQGVVQKNMNKQLINALGQAQCLLQAQDGMLERAHAQLVVQDFHLDQCNKTLKGKEDKKSKKTDCTKLFLEGKGRHLTDNRFIAALENDKATRDAEDAVKALWKAQRVDKKAERNAIEVQWKAMLAEHDAAVAQWQHECEVQANSGVAKKNLPSKPKHPLKPKMMKHAAVEEESASEQSDDKDL